VASHKHVDLASERLNLDDAGPRWRLIALAVGGIGLVGGFVAAGGLEGGWRQFWHSWLANAAFFTSLALGALFFTLIQHLTRAGWSVVVRRFAEIVAGNVIVPCLFLLAPIVYKLSEVFPWADPAVAHGDPLVEAKLGYLNPTFFLIRTAVYFAIWGVLSRWFLARSTEQDATGDPELTVRMQRWAAPGTLLFALTVTFFSFDWLMSLKPQWFSTIFGVYFFAGCIVGFFALLPLISMLVQRAGRIRGLIHDEHYHDMGKLVFAFIVFWAYIGFSQFMLMWYANLPEETVWYAYRMNDTWANVSWLMLFGHFVAPFFLLMSRHLKRRKPVLALGACWMLAMHWMDLYWIVMPQAFPDRLPFSIVDGALFLGMGGLFAAAALGRMSSRALVPQKDPRLAESIRFENI
jgi:hypothetical protein